MKGNSTNPKVLLCTVYRRFPGDNIDLIGEHVIKFPRAGAPIRVSPGLRFIKQNVPEVEILEYPLWHEYIEKLKEGWDIVGFSFYMYQIDEISKMIEEARKCGVKTIWAGNYGALTDVVPSMVDRIFVGPAIDEIAQVFGYRVLPEQIEHPIMMGYLSLISGIKYVMFGMLYTTFGCPYNCKFCQTPTFIKNRFTINFESIERVIAHYNKIGVHDIAVLDELFGAYPEHTDKLTKLLAKYKMRWWAQSRVEVFLPHIEVWYERGLRLPGIGVECMSQKSLNGMNKNQKVEQILEFAERTRNMKGMFRLAFSMVGYPEMNAKETMEDSIRLLKAGFDICRASVITPFPNTPVWDDTSSKYGFFERKYRHFDSHNLVWKHPHITPSKMQELLKEIKGFLNNPMDVYRRGLGRLFFDELRQNGLKFLWRNLIVGPLKSRRINDRELFFFPKLKQEDSKNAI